MKIYEISDQSFDEEVLQCNLLTLVHFWAEWSGPCSMVEPILVELSTEYDELVKIVKLDIDKNPICTERCGITSVPNICLYKDGERVDQIIGALQKSLIDERIKRYM